MKAGLFFLFCIFIVQAIGFVLVDFGVPTRTLLVTGYEETEFSGVSILYLCFMISGLAVYISLMKYKVKLFSSEVSMSLGNMANVGKLTIQRYFSICAFVSVVCFFIAYHYFGLKSGLWGEIGRGELTRSHSGLLRLLVINYFPKVLFSSLVYILTVAPVARCRLNYFYFIIVLINVVFMALSTGYRGAPMVYLFGGFFVYFIVSKRSLMSRIYGLLALLSVMMVVGFSWWSFMSDSVNDLSDLPIIVMQRVFLIPAEVPWYFVQEGWSWNYPEWARTLSYVLGGTVLRELAPETALPFLIEYHWSRWITYSAGYSMQTIINGHSMTSTAFGEGFYSFGFLGILVFGAFAGGLFYLIVNLIVVARGCFNLVVPSLFSVYAYSQYYAWFNGGGIARLFDVAVILSYMMSAVLIVVIFNLSRIRALK